jgi:hypothetical protein
VYIAIIHLLLSSILQRMTSSVRLRLSQGYPSAGAGTWDHHIRSPTHLLRARHILTDYTALHSVGGSSSISFQIFAFTSIHSSTFVFLKHTSAPVSINWLLKPAARALPLDHNVLHGFSSNFSQWEQGRTHQPSNTSTISKQTVPVAMTLDY